MGIPFLWAISCKQEFRTVELSHREPSADIHIHDFRREKIKQNGKKEWYMKATDAFLYRSEGGVGESRIAVYEFTLDQYGTGGEQTGTVRAKTGIVDYEKKTVFLEGDVVYTEGPNTSIEGSSMTYDMDKKILSSDKEVVIREDGVFTRCRGGMIVEKEIDRQICKEPAGQAKSTPEQNRNDSDGGGASSSPVEGLFH